jgi:hypothetical protein|tara:strand:- start:65444 stop:67087 length:1644 start_codon:yes stop_codon:yes gene_type:complete
MKTIKNIKQIIVLLVTALFLSACNDFIEEEIYSDITAESFLDESNADQLILGLYNATRGVYKNYNYKFEGTDIFTSQNEVTSTSSGNDYNGFNAPQTSGLWSANYGVISKANTAINRYETQIAWSEAKLGEKAYGIAQARSLRALAFFNLAQQYGGVVLDLEEPQSISNDYTRSTEEQTYTLIISELEAAISNLEDDPQTGRLSKRAAQHVLAEVYLTRAYTSFAGGSDFATAASLAESAIGGYDIRSQSFAQIFAYDNQENDEILFAGQWDDGFAEDSNNNKHSLFMFGINSTPGVTRNNQYGKKGNSLMPTPYFYSLFAANDSRDDVTLHRTIIADEASSLGDDIINVGDTIIYFPKVALSIAELTVKLDDYWVYQPDEYLYGRPAPIADVNYQYVLSPSFTNFPIMKKFEDEVFQEEGGGARDTFIFRVAGSHLLAAEAHLGAGTSASALMHLNIVRERATGVVDHYASASLDNILEERALELIGESNRWTVLKRMGKLEERINLYNPHVVDHGAFDSTKHLLRPIPIKELELSPDTMVQNPKY